jgi:hypothetical protein
MTLLELFRVKLSQNFNDEIKDMGKVKFFHTVSQIRLPDAGN